MNRITSTTSNRRMLADLMKAQQSMTRAQARLSSGKELQKASDGPARALAAMDHRQVLRRSDQFQRNASDATGWLVAADTALTASVEQLNRARTLVASARSGASDPNALKAIADELSTIRDGLVQLANTKYLDRSIFGGNADVTAAYDGTGTYQGDAGTVLRPVAEAVTLQVNRTGPEVFGVSDPGDPMNGNVFEVLDATIAAVLAGDTSTMATGIQQMDVATDRIESSQVELGARARQVEDVMARTELLDLDRKQALSEVEDVDVAQALIDVEARQFSFQAALSATAKVVQTSLLDFLR